MTAEGKSLWGGGYAEAMHPTLVALSDSLDEDLPLADADLRASAVYARALGRCGVLSEADAAHLGSALEALRRDLASTAWIPHGTEDIHTAIEQEVTRRVGSLGERLHTGRSRNDQVSTAFRLAAAERLDKLKERARALVSTLAQRAEQEIDTFAPSYTHIQRAQPIRLAHWLLGYAWPLVRDCERLEQLRPRVLTLPLGSGAVSGHPFGLDRAWVAEELGFVRVGENSLDAVGDRDFAIELVFSATMIATHLSRLAEELVLFSTTEFSFVRWPDALSTGSSLMPNKKNPDLAELVRGRAALAIGDTVSLLALVKGLPGSYQRDLQDSKPALWRTTDSVLASLAAMDAAMANIRFERERMKSALSDDLLATEAADVLVQRGLPFRSAHSLVAQAVAMGRKKDLSLKELAKQAPESLPAGLNAADLLGLEVEAAIERRNTPGGTGRAAVLAQLSSLRARLVELAKS